MLLEATNLSKSIGTKVLFQDTTFSIVPGEKVALIGRNGYGKTTLLKILSAEDHDFDGKITTKKGIRVTLTKQEHIHNTAQSPLDYVLESVPHYHEYQTIITEYESGVQTDLQRYLKAIEFFTDHNYFNIVDAILSSFSAYGIAEHAAHGPLGQLSGGEKRYVEMTRMMFCHADLLLVDEPTNHMDYQGKEGFITWMKSLRKTIVVVTHDRDVLKHVTKIIELKDQKMTIFKGNYDAYIEQNATQTLTSVKMYGDQLNRLKEAKKRLEWGLQMRAKSKAWKIRYDHWLKDYEKIKAQTVKPEFWIDQSTVEDLDQKVVDSYEKFKEKNIKIAIKTQKKRGGELIKVSDLSLSYDTPVFEHVSFSLKEGERVFIKGRNGAGKSTLVKTLMALAHEQTPQAKIVSGEVVFGRGIQIGEYQQEIQGKYLEMTLEDAITLCYQEKNVEIDQQKVKSLLAQYLFHPILDARQKIAQLSGGQKARFQLIKMFIGEPNVLILDEPTNHLDLPSIEELENALDLFAGGILFISHDTYFIDRMGGDVVEI